MKTHCELITDDIDLIYSRDDKGYYLQNYSLDKISPIFSTRAAALHALKTNQIVWE